jgi:hypothetical protein
MRRVHLRAHANIRKRLLIHAGGFNLGLLLRQLIGVGTPRGLQGRLIAVLATLLALSRDLWKCDASSRPRTTHLTARGATRSRNPRRAHRRARNAFHHGPARMLRRVSLSMC